MKENLKVFGGENQNLRRFMEYEFNGWEADSAITLYSLQELF